MGNRTNSNIGVFDSEDYNRIGMGRLSLSGVIYPCTMEITSEFGSFVQVERELVHFMNIHFDSSFADFKEVLEFMFGDLDSSRVELLNPHEKKWISVAVLLAIPLRHTLFQNSPISTYEFQRLCEEIECDTFDDDIMFSFNKFEVSSERLSELIRHMYLSSLARVSVVESKLELVAVVESRFKGQEGRDTERGSSGSKGVVAGEERSIVLGNVQMIESQIGDEEEHYVTGQESPSGPLPTADMTYLRLSVSLNILLLTSLLFLTYWVLS